MPIIDHVLNQSFESVQQKWEKLGHSAPDRLLKQARQQLHRAVQMPASVGYTCVSRGTELVDVGGAQDRQLFAREFIASAISASRKLLTR